MIDVERCTSVLCFSPVEEASTGQGLLVVRCCPVKDACTGQSPGKYLIAPVSRGKIIFHSILQIAFPVGRFEVFFTFECVLLINAVFIID